MKKIIASLIVLLIIAPPVDAKKISNGLYVHKLGYNKILKDIKRYRRQWNQQRRAVIDEPTYTYQDPQSYLAYVVKQNGLSEYDYQALNSIMYCESKYNPNATNPYSGAKGLFQFLDSSWAIWGQGSAYDPVSNINAAVRYYKVAGVSPWIQCVY